VSSNIGSPHNQRLDSWKEIAAYLRRDERTAIRWEKDRGLPVRRVPGGKRQAVFAYASELDAWLTQETFSRATEPAGHKGDLESDRGSDPLAPLPILAGNSRLRRFALRGLVVVVLLGALSLFALFGRSRPSQLNFPVRIDFSQDSVLAFDQEGKLLWTHAFPGKLILGMLSVTEPLSHFSYIGDFRGEGDQEVLLIAPYRSGPNPEDMQRTEVDLFSSRGQLLWSYHPHARFEFGTHELSGAWLVLNLLVTPHGNRKQIWASVSDEAWGNTFVVNLDPVTGKDTLRFVNTGTIHSLSEMTTPHGTFLIAGGFNNEPDTGSLAVIDEARPFAASPQSAGTRHKCMNCPSGDPDYYFEFPRSEINELEQVHEDAVRLMHVSDQQIEIWKNEEAPDSGGKTIYLLKEDLGLRVVSVRFDSSYDMRHRELEHGGKIDHPLERCPEHLHPKPIRMWTPAGGWTEIHLPPTPADQ
jgi:hypothetical protein